VARREAALEIGRQRLQDLVEPGVHALNPGYARADGATSQQLVGATVDVLA